MKIYQIVCDNGRMYEDNDVYTVMISEYKFSISQEMWSIMNDDDFSITEWKKSYSYSIIVWENGKEIETVWTMTVNNKMETMNFLDKFIK